jgi:glycosyltransferase EpsD
MGGIIARLAARQARKYGTKVFYTVHGFHFYKGAPIKNWVLFYPIEKWFAGHYTDKVITITREDYNLAKDKFHTEVCYIHGLGANSEKYTHVTDEEKLSMRKAHGFDTVAPILLCVGELNKNKNQETAIRAMVGVRKIFSDCILLVAGNGPSENDLKALVKELHLENNVVFLGYTLELDKYLHITDVAISLSFREGLPFNIMEAMLCKRPVIASDNRGHRELIENGVTGMIVPATAVDEIAKSIKQMLSDNKLQTKMADQALQQISAYTDESVMKELEEIYGM